MINSRKLEDLHPHVQKLAEELLSKCEAEGINLIVTSTFRDLESQASLYAQGRTAPGKKVTNAKPGDSWHNWKCAFDVVPVVNGKAIWNDEATWKRVGEIGVNIGLEWAGNWKTFKEYPHFQYTGGLKLADFKSGKTLDTVLV